MKHPKRFAWAAFVLLLGLVAFAIAQTPVPVTEGFAYSESESARALMLTPGKIFTFFFVMLGPLKILGPFVRSTYGMDIAEARRLAFKGVLIACLAGVLAAVAGQRIILNWGLSSASLLLAAGLVMLLIALRAILSQFQPGPHVLNENEGEGSRVSPLSLAFPNIVTPYGVAALILLLGASEGSRDLNIFGIFLGVMAINFVAMWFARPILKYTSGALQILSALFGVLQVALAIQLLVGGFRLLGVVPPLSN
ncbi:MAG TPA: MarC family protein [Pyrinomonadaceae bacterium]|nr:MarC family protein [Pyrinomonadaceae bacterium]